MKQSIGSVIAKYRKSKKLSQLDLAQKLTAYDIHVKNAAISAWEKGSNTPTAAQLLALCEILEIQDIYKEFIGKNPSDPFRNLNAEGIRKAYDYIELLEGSSKYCAPVTEVLPFTPRVMRIALTSASAGTGNFLDDENFDEVEIYEPVPSKASFGVYIDGDSMEPFYKNDQLIWIEQTEYLEDGDLGLFYLDGMTYFKKLKRKKNGTFLVSLNAKYKPIPVTEYSTFKIFGKCLESPLGNPQK